MRLPKGGFAASSRASHRAYIIACGIFGALDPLSTIYLDNNATTRALPTVVEAVVGVLSDNFANPSSPHGRGAYGKRLLSIAREQVAMLLGCDSDAVTFTSGATESNNAVIAMARRAGLRVVCSAGDHASILETALRSALDDTATSVIGLDRRGLVDLAELKAVLADDRPSLVALHWVNSETGVIQPVEQIAEIGRRHDAVLLFDAAQAVGRITIDMSGLDADYLTFSGHKVHAPQGTGVLLTRAGVTPPVLLLGGGQERGCRAGTENLPGIVGLGVACEERRRNAAAAVARMETLRDRFEAAVLAELDDVLVNGSAARVVNTSNLRFAGVDGQALVAQLDRAGIACSQASACSSQRPEPSAMLRAMGLSEEEAFQSVRFSFSIMNTDDEVDRAVDLLDSIVQRLRLVS